MTARTPAALALLTTILGCRGGGATPGFAPLISGDPSRGHDAIRARSCGACHHIPGVVGAYGVIGPPLTGIARRSFLAGNLPNTPENLTRWIREPRTILRTTAMPTLGLAETEARDVVAYLYTLDQEEP